MKNNVTNSIMLTIISSIILRLMKNKSQVSNEYAIPLVVSAILWYIIGNWDKKNMLSINNFIYWILIMILSYIVVKFTDFVR